MLRRLDILNLIFSVDQMTASAQIGGTRWTIRRLIDILFWVNDQFDTTGMGSGIARDSQSICRARRWVESEMW